MNMNGLFNKPASLLIFGLAVGLSVSGCGGGAVSSPGGESSADTVAPLVTIAMPTTQSNYTATSAAITLTGNATDAVGVTQVSWTNSRGGSGGATSGGTATAATWNTGAVALQSGSNVISVTARDAAGNTGSNTLTVNYGTSTSSTLGVSVIGSGTVTSSPAGINCGAQCSANFSIGAQVTLTAAANPGYTFSGWSEDGASCATASTCVLSLTASKSVTATFSATGTGSIISASCNSLYAQHAYVPASGTTAHNEAYPSLAKPARGVAIQEETYGTCRVRATDYIADATNALVRNDYSRRQAFNADSTRYLINARNGFWHLYDAATFTRISVLPGLAGDAEPQWHPTNPNLLYFLPLNGGMVVNELNVSTSVIRVVGNFTTNGVKTRWPAAARVWTKSEGSPSADGRYWAFMVENIDHTTTLGFITWDLQTDTVLGYYDLVNEVRPDHLSMTPSGKYVIVSWNGGNAVTNPGPTIFDRGFTTRRLVNSDNPRGEHSDIALDANGNDVYVSIDVTGPPATGNVYMVTITDTSLTKINLFSVWDDGDPNVSTSNAIHVSGKSFNKPGWALVSTYSPRGAKLWMSRKIFAVKLEANPTVIHLAHTHEIFNTYITEPHATANRDFTKILFNSNWDVNTTTDIDAYMLELPAGALQ